jgi:CubicO group peptidase (beta-lactamase class C family)
VTTQILTFPQQLVANELSPDISSRIDAIFAEWDRPDSPGVALGIYQDGKIAYSRGYGMSNLEHGIPIVPDSIFHIASISKQFAGIAIALLAHEGKLDVDTDIRTWLPEVPDFGPTITLRHLMQHTSGLRDQWSLLAFAGWREEDLVTDDDVLDLVSRQRELNFPPGERYLYSNTGFTLMSLIVKRVSGQTLRQFTQERVFGPLGMTRTHFQDDHSEIVPGRTQAYLRRDGGGYRVSIPEFDVAGATSLFSTVEDFFHWNVQFTTERVAPAAVLEEFQRPGSTNDGKDIGYGWGIATTMYRGVTFIGHSGADHGYRAEYLRSPEHGVGVTVFANYASITPSLLARKVFDVLLEYSLDPREEEAAIQESERGPAPTDLDRYLGVFRNADEATTTATSIKEGSLRLGIGDGRELIWIGDHTFRLTDIPASRLRFQFAESGELDVLSVNFGWGALELTKVSDIGPVRFEDFVGTFTSDELGVRWEIALANGQPELRRRKRKPSILIASGADRLAGSDDDRPMEFAFERDEHGQVSGFRLNQGRIRNLAFVRDV